MPGFAHAEGGSATDELKDGLHEVGLKARLDARHADHEVAIGVGGSDVNRSARGTALEEEVRRSVGQSGNALDRLVKEGIDVDGQYIVRVERRL